MSEPTTSPARRDDESASRARGEVPWGMALLSEAGELRAVDASLSRLLARPAPDLIRRPWTEVCPPECRGELLEAQRRADEAGCYAFDHAHRGARAEPVRLRMELTALRDEVGRLQRVLRVSEITDRAEASRARARLASLVDSSDDAIMAVDLDGTIVHWNRGAERVYGWSAEQALGRSVLIMVPAERREEAERDLETIRAGGHVATRETERRCADGRRIRVSVTVSPIRDAGGALIGASWIARDITERVRAEESLARERAILDALIRSSPAVIYVKDLDGRYLLINQHTLTDLRLTEADFLGRTDHDVFPTDVAAQLVADDRQAVTTRSVVHTEEVVRTGGIERTFASAKFPIFAPDGSVRAVGGISLDITERKRVEEALRASERLLRTVIDVLPVGVWILDRDGRILRGNAAAARIWGGVHFVGIDGYDQYTGWWADTGERIEAHEWGAARAIERGETSVGEVVRIRAFDGALRTLYHSAVPLRDDAGELAGAVVVNQDITALRETADALKRAVAAREHILGIVSHDLRTPLAVVSMASDFLSSGALDASSLRAGLARIRRAADTMNRLIGDLIDLVRVDQGRLSLRRSPERADELVQEVVGLLRPQAEAASIHLSFAAPAGLPLVVADHHRIVQVFSNIIGNALKFTPAGGRIEVRAEARDRVVDFSVTDTGPGIPDDHLARLFDSYWQGAPTDERGLGLGLAIARGIVEAHGGRIWATSAPGSGSTFHFTLPAAERRGATRAQVR